VTDVDRKVGDSILIPSFFESELADIPDYEEALVRGLNMYLQPGMSVVIVGAGIGVTAVIAAKLIGSLGQVTCYEASLKNVGRIREVAIRNKVAEQINVHYGLVGPSIAVYHGDNRAPQVDLKNLSECDLLELDCEGSEKDIIAELPILPKHIVVETHGLYGAKTKVIDDLLKQKGYNTVNLGIAEPRVKSFCDKNDIYVIGAELCQHLP
jgi:hypothetical protein